MKFSITLGVVVVALIGGATSAIANDLMIFPANGQTSEQLEQDKYSCYGWAKGQTGFDPMVVPTASTPPPSQQKKSGGAARGALGGAVSGVIIGDSRKSARRGAAAGGLIGGMRQGSANSATEQKTREWEQRETDKYINDRNQYNRAYGACLEGKGYTVK
ncbi:MAG: hypothetical protein DRQ42_09655 [Gammaproteobacteria bacterium]|nr:MAG: hypothetical protein DRQ46_09315 [Gammaproteobacteria bacterium]RKZ97366.1 MAG: hypothetical protein DRQ42_09655 [Gammaproteobacteria bacterium]